MRLFVIWHEQDVYFNLIIMAPTCAEALRKAQEEFKRERGDEMYDDEGKELEDGYKLSDLMINEAKSGMIRGLEEDAWSYARLEYEGAGEDPKD